MMAQPAFVPSTQASSVPMPQPAGPGPDMAAFLARLHAHSKALRANPGRSPPQQIDPRIIGHIMALQRAGR
jgi:hypothetical protein